MLPELVRESMQTELRPEHYLSHGSQRPGFVHTVCSKLSRAMDASVLERLAARDAARIADQSKRAKERE